MVERFGPYAGFFSGLCSFRGHKTFRFLFTWRAGDGGTLVEQALVLSLVFSRLCLFRGQKNFPASAYLEGRRWWDSTGPFASFFSRLCSFRGQNTFRPLFTWRAGDGVTALVLSLVFSRLCSFRGQNTFRPLFTWRAGDGGTALILSLVFSGHCLFRGQKPFRCLCTWRAGDGGTALVLFFLHQAVLAHWLDERADSRKIIKK
jgi:hypothetical protein